MSPARAEIIAQGARRLAGAGVPDPERDARYLYRWAARLDGAALSAALGDPASADEVSRFTEAIDRRAERVPVSQITGIRAFWGRNFEVTADVLDPRPETETLIAAALDGPQPGRILDLGTGSGCILLTLLAEIPSAQGTGADLSTEALAVARRNAEHHGLADRCQFVRSDWFAGITGTFDLIAANPPYIAESEMPALSPEVRLHEPRMALTPGGDGLEAYRRIAEGICAHSAPGARILLEIGPGQATDVTAIMTGSGIPVTGVLTDFDARNRVISARVAGKKHLSV